LIDNLLQLPRRNRPLLAGVQQSAQHFLPVELLPPAILLHHHVGNLVDSLVRRKPLIAALALAPPANRIGLFALARIDHAILGKPAVRTLHRNTSILPAQKSTSASL